MQLQIKLQKSTEITYLEGNKQQIWFFKQIFQRDFELIRRILI